jgi:tRNA(adenine34) deaminase
LIQGRVRPDDERFLRLAIRQAEVGDRRPGGGEVGCVIVRDGEVISSGHNEAELHNDPTAHAEIVTLRKACEKLKTLELSGCTLYCTLQPCGMCTLACLWAKINRIVYGAGRREVHAMYFEERHLNTIDFIRDAFRDDVEIVGGVLVEECARFYYAPGDQPPPGEAEH